MNVLWQNSTFLPIRRQIHAIHRNLIDLVVLRCFDHFDIKSMQSHCVLITFGFCVVLNVLWQNSTFLPIRHQIDAKSLYFDHFWSFTVFWMFCDKTRHFCQFDIESIQVIVFWSLLEFCVVLNVLWQNSTFLPIRRQMHAIHRHLIALVVLRCFDHFDIKSMQSHCTLITFGVLRCFECFVTKLDIFANSMSNACNSSSFDRFGSFAFFWSFWHQIDAKSLYFDHFWSFTVFWMFCDKTRHFCQFDIKSIQVIVFWSLLEFCVVLNVLWQNSTFFTIRHQIDSSHCILITFGVLRCIECFVTKLDIFANSTSNSCNSS